MVHCSGDCRPFRLDLHPSTAVYILDFPDVMAYRQQALQGASSACTVVNVSCDLSKPTWTAQLLDAGYLPQRKSLWLVV